MEITFNYIRNRLRDYSKKELLDFCYSYLDLSKDGKRSIWFIFLLMKWTYLYAEEKYPIKKLTEEKFVKILNAVSNFNPEHISSFIKEKNIDRAFYILHSQQFYLQKTVYKEIFAIQLKLYNSITGKYDINKSFEEKTGLSIFDFILISQIVWLFINIEQLPNDELKFEGILEDDFLRVASEITSIKKIENYLQLLVLNPLNPIDKILEFKRKVNNVELQSMETTFFTLFPFQIHNNQIKLVHKSVFIHTINYYVYDYLKSNDELFPTEFGRRFEKYIELGIKEMEYKYKTEKQLEKILKEKSNLIDFQLESDNIYIECKAVEMQAISMVNPTDEILYNSMRGSILKAYFKQLLNVSKQISPKNENWGIIITYKELFWSRFTNLYELGKEKFDNSSDFMIMPPENVFLIDIYTWNHIVQIVKDKKATLLEILQKAKLNNSKDETAKALFSMHLDEYNLERFDLGFLKDELKSLEIK